VALCAPSNKKGRREAPLLFLRVLESQRDGQHRD